jgi:hypothetical protein
LFILDLHLALLNDVLRFIVWLLDLPSLLQSLVQSAELLKIASMELVAIEVIDETMRQRLCVVLLSVASSNVC